MGKKRYTTEDENRIIEIRQQFPNLTRQEIIEKTGCSLAFIKRTIAKHDVNLTLEQRQKNAYIAKLVKDPGAMEKMRRKLTSDVVEKRSLSIKERYKNDKTLALLAKARTEKWYKENLKQSKYTWTDLLNKLDTLKMSIISDKIESGEFAWGQKQIDIKCHCGNNFDSKIYDVLLDKVKSCGCISSGPERDIKVLINSWGIKTLFDDWTILDNKFELDIAIPDYKIAIEYCGLHWHGENINGDKARNKHLQKMKLARDKGYRLITIFSDEWLLRKNQVIGYLKSILGKIDNKIGARECTFSKVELCDIYTFMDENHIQHPSGNIAYKLEYNNQIVAAMIFRKTSKRRLGETEEGVYELTRYAVQNGYLVNGGFSKLLSSFIKDFNPKQVISFSDNRWSAGGVYLRNGFVADKVNYPNYWYFKKCRDYPRFNKAKFRKDKIFKLTDTIIEDTEWNMMQELGYDRIWDCGTTRWILDLTNTNDELN